MKERLMSPELQTELAEAIVKAKEISRERGERIAAEETRRTREQALDVLRNLPKNLLEWASSPQQNNFYTLERNSGRSSYNIPLNDQLGGILLKELTRAGFNVGSRIDSSEPQEEPYLVLEMT